MFSLQDRTDDGQDIGFSGGVLLYQLVSSSLYCDGSRGVPVASNASCAVVIFKTVLSAFFYNNILGHFSPQDPMLSSIHLETSNAYKWQYGLPTLTLAMGHCKASPEVEALPIPPHARARDLSTKTSSQHPKLRSFTSCRRTKVRSELSLGVVAQDLRLDEGSRDDPTLLANQLRRRKRPSASPKLRS